MPGGGSPRSLEPGPWASSVAAGAAAGMLAALVTVPYVLGWLGLPLMPGVVAAVAGGAGVLAGAAMCAPSPRRDDTAPFAAWAAVVIGVAVWLVGESWPLLLPPGGGSDLSHHLLLVDVLDRTRHLVDGNLMGGALGEMAHYTPGLHLAIVTLGSLSGVDAWRATHPLMVATVALKAGFLFLIAHPALAGIRARLPLALASVLLVLFVPRVYSLGGFLQSGYLAQVAAEVFVVAGWWAVMEWQASPATGRLALAGACTAAAFLVWPMWIGPLVLATAAALLLGAGPAMPARLRAAAVALAPITIVAAMHLSRHAAWLRIAGTSGAVPAFLPDPAWWALVSGAILGLAASWRAPALRVTVWFLAALALQAAVLVAVARRRGAETPYMAVKMTYLAAYPLAVLAAIGLGQLLRLVPVRIGRVAGWAAVAGVGVVAARLASAFVVPAPIVSADLFAAGAWARGNLDPACVDYLVASGDTAYWLHLAVMGQPRASARTAELDRYTLNAAAGRWIDGSSRPYAVADLAVLPAEVRETVEDVRRVGGAVVIRRAPRPGYPDCTPSHPIVRGVTLGTVASGSR